MPTSAYQEFKLWIVHWVPLSKDAIHILLGLACFSASVYVMRQSPRTWSTLLLGLVVSVSMELLDARDNLDGLGIVRWADSLKDLMLGNLFPFLIVTMLRDTHLFPRPALLSPTAQLMLGVFGAIIDAQGRLLLLHRCDMDKWCMPGGLMEVGEDIQTALIRECREELGVEVEIGELMGIYTDPKKHLFRFKDGRVRHFVTIVFYVRIVTGEPRSASDESDSIAWFASDQLPAVVPSHAVWIGDSFIERTRPNVY